MNLDPTLVNAASVITATLIARERDSLLSSIDKVGATFTLVYSQLEYAAKKMENNPELTSKQIDDIRKYIRSVESHPTSTSSY